MRYTGSTIKISSRNLKTQAGFIQKSLELRKKYETFGEPEILHIKKNPKDFHTPQYCLELIQKTDGKDNTNPEILRLLSIETINTRYPSSLYSYIYGSKLHIHGSAGAGIYCKLFSFYISTAQTNTAFDDETEVILTALNQTACRLQTNNFIVIL